MSDDQREIAVALPGEPAGWPATVRDILRYLREESPSREEVVGWLREETDPTDPDVAEERLAFLEDAGVVDASEGRSTPGPHGREFLDTHDESVLYEALTSTVDGFETLLESLAVRPLTDVEFADLLEREFGADLGSTDPVLAHRQWLQALGYVEHDDGVNDLTRTGRLRVETDDDLTPPRANRPRESAGAEGDVSGSLPGASETTGSGAHERSGGTSGAESDATRNETVDGVAAAGETAEEDEAGKSDTGDCFEALKHRYDHTCMVCGDRRQRSPGEGYARIFHPMPTDDAHGGPAEPANAVVVCPNHHADFECGLLTVDPQTREIDHAYEQAVSGRTLATVDGHDPGAQYLAYHKAVVADV